jgi:hypothetical protein
MIFFILWVLFSRGKLAVMALLFSSRTNLAFEANQWFFFACMQISVNFSFHAALYLYRYFSSVMVTYYFFLPKSHYICKMEADSHFEVDIEQSCCMYSKKKKTIMYSLSRNGLQLLHIICEFKKCGFVLMQSTTLDKFQSVALGSLWSGCWLIERDGEKESRLLCGFSR